MKNTIICVLLLSLVGCHASRTEGYAEEIRHRAWAVEMTKSTEYANSKGSEKARFFCKVLNGNVRDRYVGFNAQGEQLDDTHFDFALWRLHELNFDFRLTDAEWFQLQDLAYKTYKTAAIVDATDTMTLSDVEDVLRLLRRAGLD
jgi:hypothetical protein